MALTERQQEIKALLDQGKTPKQIGEQLGISENAVYQQRRRIKLAGDQPRSQTKTPRKQASKRASKQASKTSRPRQQRQAPAPVAQAEEDTAAEPANPLNEVRRRQAEIDGMLAEAKTTLDESAKAHATAQKAYDDAESKVKVEMERLAAVEALLTGKLKPPVKAPKAKAEEAPAEAPAEPPAEHEAVAEAQDQAAEAPDQPTEVPASDNGAGDEEERPGVPTVPEFAQEDAFAS
jgi:transposase